MRYKLPILVAFLLTASPLTADEKGRILFTFDRPAAANSWLTVNDGVMGGRSVGRFKINADKKLEFFGTLSLENNGGFASVRASGPRLGLEKGDSIVVRLRGDGREYSLNLYTPRRVTAFSYRAKLATKKNQWIEVRVPLDKFVATSFGRVVRNQPLDPGEVNGIGILLGDKKAGPFKLEVDWIKVSKSTMDLSGIVDGGNRFALDLYQQLRSEEGNLFFSPSSMAIALAMAYAGAAGETEAEMAKTLHFQMPKDQLHDGMRALQSFWTAPDEKKGIRLNLANRLWGQESYEFLTAFLQVTRDQYGVELARLDFAETEDARQAINAWVEDQTENKITDLLAVGVLTPDTKLVLTNAVYFHGIWAEPFQQDRTKDEDFHLTSADKIKVPMMHCSEEFRYGAVDALQILELPYGDGSLSMVVLLPKQIDGLGGLEAKLTFQNLQRWMASVKHENEVKVYLPKFKTTSQFQMADTLKAMGMESAFDAKAADFSGMTGGRDLFISAVIHKAFVDVNEEGTEAAAATGVVFEPTAAPIQEPKKPPVFRADHPFVFLIRDNHTSAILFLGRIANPLE